MGEMGDRGVGGCDLFEKGGEEEIEGGFNTLMQMLRLGGDQKGRLFDEAVRRSDTADAILAASAVRPAPGS